MHSIVDTHPYKRSEGSQKVRTYVHKRTKTLWLLYTACVRPHLPRGSSASDSDDERRPGEGLRLQNRVFEGTGRRAEEPNVCLVVLLQDRRQRPITRETVDQTGRPTRSHARLAHRTYVTSKVSGKHRRSGRKQIWHHVTRFYVKQQGGSVYKNTLTGCR